MVIHLVPFGFGYSHIYAPIKKYGGDKIYLFVSNAKNSEAETKISDGLKKAKSIAKEIGLDLEIIQFKKNFSAEERISVFKRIFEKHDKFVINITGGTKFDCLLIYFIANIYPDKVVDIVYVREDLNEIINLPLPWSVVSITDFERELLNKIPMKDYISVRNLSEVLDKSYPQVLRYVKNLEEKRLVITIKEGGKRLVKKTIWSL